MPDQVATRSTLLGSLAIRDTSAIASSAADGINLLSVERK